MSKFYMEVDLYLQNGTIDAFITKSITRTEETEEDARRYIIGYAQTQGYYVRDLRLLAIKKLP